MSISGFNIWLNVLRCQACSLCDASVNSHNPIKHHNLFERCRCQHTEALYESSRNPAQTDSWNVRSCRRVEPEAVPLVLGRIHCNLGRFEQFFNGGPVAGVGAHADTRRHLNSVFRQDKGGYKDAE